MLTDLFLLPLFSGQRVDFPRGRHTCVRTPCTHLIHTSHPCTPCTPHAHPRAHTLCTHLMHTPCTPHAYPCTPMHPMHPHAPHASPASRSRQCSIRPTRSLSCWRPPRLDGSAGRATFGGRVHFRGRVHFGERVPPTKSPSYCPPPLGRIPQEVRPARGRVPGLNGEPAAPRADRCGDASLLNQLPSVPPDSRPLSPARGPNALAMVLSLYSHAGTPAGLARNAPLAELIRPLQLAVRRWPCTLGVPPPRRVRWVPSRRGWSPRGRRPPSSRSSTSSRSRSAAWRSLQAACRSTASATLAPWLSLPAGTSSGPSAESARPPAVRRSGDAGSRTGPICNPKSEIREQSA